MTSLSLKKLNYIPEGKQKNTERNKLFVFAFLQPQNKTRTPQVGAISKAQKAQNIFFGKKLEIFEKKCRKKTFGKCRTVPKNVKGGPFLIYKHAFCSKITKNSKGGPFGDIKKIRKKSHSAEKKIERGGGYETLVPSGLVCNV